MWGVVVVFFAALAYFVFKLVRMWQKDYEQNYKPARRSLTTFGRLSPDSGCVLKGKVGREGDVTQSSKGAWGWAAWRRAAKR